MQVYLPEELYTAVKERGLPASELLQEAVEAELRRQRLNEAADEYLAELTAEVGEPSSRERARAAAIARRLRDRAATRAGWAVLVLDSGGLSRLSQRTRRAAALIEAFRAYGLWPPLVPTIVLAESTSGAARTDANINRLLKACDIDPIVSEAIARRAGALRARARRGSAVDAVLVAVAEPGGTVLTGDIGDLEALAGHSDGVMIERV
jgi:hypothetical protein